MGKHFVILKRMGRDPMARGSRRLDDLGAGAGAIHVIRTRGYANLFQRLPVGSVTVGLKNLVPGPTSFTTTICGGRNAKKGRLLYNCKSNFLKMLCQ